MTGTLVGDAFFERVKAIVGRYRSTDGWSAYSAGELTRAGAAIYTQQHGLFTRHSRRAWAYVVANCPEVEVRRFIVRENLLEEEGSDEGSHYLKLVKMARAVGLSQPQVDDAAPLPSTRAALLIWETLTKDRHWLLGAAAKGALEFRTTSGVEGQRWMAQLGLSRDDVDFWLMHHEADQVHGAGSLELVRTYAARQHAVTESDLFAAMEDSLFAYRLFRTGIADAARAAA
jgi:pyrroloquinoline quinone (PQQ) biosynthesis protein C